MIPDMFKPDPDTNAGAPSVLFLTRKWPPAIGGMETYSVRLVQALRDQGLNVDAMVLPGRDNGYPPTFLHLVFFFIRAAWYLCCHTQRYDVIHFADPVLFPLAWWHSQFSSATRTMTVHGLDMVYQRRHTFSAALYGLFLRWASNHKQVVDLYLANSAHTAGLAEEASFSPVRIVNLGVEIPERIHSPDEKAGEEGGNPYLLLVGRLVRRKGAAWFVRNVLPRLPSGVRVKVVGIPWEDREMEVLRQSDQAEWLGTVSEEQLGELYRHARATIMPNLWPENDMDVEGFGLVALEAAAHGSTPVVAAVQGLKDAVRHGENGFLVQPADPDAWEHAIEKILDWNIRERADFLDRARRTLEKHYTWETVARNTADAYRTASLNHRHRQDQGDGRNGR